jgi:hypothetical protein
VAPKGAFVHGRITHLRRQQTSRAGWAIGMTMFEMEWQNTRVQVRAKLEDTPTLSLLAGSSANYRQFLRQTAYQEGVILFPGNRLLVPRGFLMNWRTQPLPSEATSDSIRTRN